MKIDFNEKDGIVIFNLSGKVMGGEDATMFHGHIHEHVDAGKTKVVVNLAKVDWMSSVGLGMLIAALTTLKNNKGDLKIANVTKSIETLITITRVITVFDTYDSVEEAVNAF
jgi:anti-sigma B factor antagonist